MHRFEDNRINEALVLLNETARDKKTELQAAMENNFPDLSTAVNEFSDRANNGASKGFAAGKRKLAGVANSIGKSIHSNPWPYIGSLAAAALVSGFLIGRSRRD